MQLLAGAVDGKPPVDAHVSSIALGRPRAHLVLKLLEGTNTLPYTTVWM